MLKSVRKSLFSTYRNTIYALSTGYGRSAISVVRVSGSEAKDALHMTKKLLFKNEQTSELSLKPRYAHFKTIYDIHSPNLNPIDQALLLFFKGPKSYTGEDMVEFHLHGGTGVKNGVLNCLSQFPTFREAEPGEFTKRALLNGKLDLL